MHFCIYVHAQSEMTATQLTSRTLLINTPIMAQIWSRALPAPVAQPQNRGPCGKYLQSESKRANKTHSIVSLNQRHIKGEMTACRRMTPVTAGNPWSYQHVSAAFTQPPCVITLWADVYTWMFAFPRIDAHIQSNVGFIKAFFLLVFTSAVPQQCTGL